jgi:LuxR family transcriptional regulator, maltose regulon positive regulatory protein
VLTGQHCDVRVLEAIADGGCFVERIPGQHDRFRYHALFRQFLLAQLWFEKSAEPAALHRQAAEWLARDGQTCRAIRHAVAASDWALACRLLIASLGFVEMLSGHRRTELLRLFAELPPAVNGAEAALARAAMSLAELDTSTAGLHLDAARASLASEHGAPAHCGTVALAVLTAVQTSLAVDTSAALDMGLHAGLIAERALRLSPAQAHPSVWSHLAAVVAGCRGRVLIARGEFLEAREALRDGVRAADAAGLEAVAGELTGMCALVEALVGNLRRASAMAGPVSHTRAVTNDEAPVPSEAARLALAWVRTDEAEPALAHELVGQAQREPVSYDSTLLAVIATVLRARLLTDRGDVQVALAELEVARGPRSSLNPGGQEEQGDPTSGWLARTLLVSQAEALMRLGRPREVIALIDDDVERSRVRDLAVNIALQRALLATRDPDRDFTRLSMTPSTPPDDRTPLAVRIARWLAMAEGSIADHDPDAASHYLNQALRLAAPEHLRRPILQATDGVQELLTSSGLASRNRWLRPRSDAAGGQQQPTVRLAGQRRSLDAHATDTSQQVVIPLTKKETEVLGYLAELLTTDEIATVMLVSVNTVRSHVRSILRKLGVSRRNEAVRRGWDLRLLPRDGAA